VLPRIECRGHHVNQGEGYFPSDCADLNSNFAYEREFLLSGIENGAGAGSNTETRENSRRKPSMCSTNSAMENLEKSKNRDEHYWIERASLREQQINI
jgi:hypothetical protein